MDDLAGLDWSKASNTTNTKPTPQPSSYNAFRQSPALPLSGRSTPLSAQQSGAIQSNNRVSKPASKPATPANDTFASLLSTTTPKPSNNLSLQERQKQLQEEKSRQEAERRKHYDAQFGAQDSRFWDTLGNGSVGSKPTSPAPQQLATSMSGGNSLSRTINKPFAGLDTASKRSVQSAPPEDDILAAFNSTAPVNSASHFPPQVNDSGRSTPAFSTQATSASNPFSKSSTNDAFGDDDDPFGLNQLAQKQQASVPPVSTTTNDDDDILGMLGKPVSEIPVPKRNEPQKEGPQPASPEGLNPEDKAVAELVDMGFPADKAAIALATTESGTDIQAAVGWLLNQAHAEAKQKTQAREGRGRESPLSTAEARQRNDPRPSARGTGASGSMPAWMKGEDERSRSAQRRQDDHSPAGDKDFSHTAQDIGSSLFKQANSLWKKGQKQVQKAVADFQQDGDPTKPKWLRDAQAHQDEPRLEPHDRAGPRRMEKEQSNAGATDEAMMLEGGSRPQKPQRHKEHHQQQPEHVMRQQREERTRSSVLPDRTASRSPAFPQQPPRPDNRPTTKLSRQDVEEQSAQAYVSPARRKKATPKPESKPAERATPPSRAPQQSPPIQSNNPFAQRQSTPITSRPTPSPQPPKPKAPPRQIPPTSPSALSSSASHRQNGTSAFKRGDYTAAHTSYTAALTPLPATHPITIILLCNRAITNLKVGDAKACISDADAALTLIGISKGEGEKIDLGGVEGAKDMREFWGKALMRKAEGLEHLEKWGDAGKVWREAVEGGVGGAVAIQGRNRCDKAVGGGSSSTSSRAATPATTAKRPPPRKPAPARPALSALADMGGADSEAVRKLKEANAAAEKADDEKFALTDQVDARLTAWKGSKSDNLRALLGSLDKVLWPEAGWKKVGMSDLVMPNRVKIVYMKAIAKVHPDKIPQTATTEQRMLSAAIFSTLNEAWDTFKKENNL